MGAIVAGFVGTHSDAEILDILQAPTSNTQAVEAPTSLPRWRITLLLDADQLEE